MREGWTYKKLGEVCEIFNGNSINADYKKKHFYGATGGLPFIATKDVSITGEIDYENGVRIPNYDSYRIAPANSVFICAEGGSAGKKFAFIEQDVCFGNKLFCLNPKTKSLIGKHVYYYIQSKGFKEQFYSLLTGLIGGVSAKKFQSIEIPLPPLSEQKAIVSQLDSAFAHIDALKANAKKQLDDAKALFQKALEKAMEPKEGWEEKKLGGIANVFSGYAFKSGTFQKEGKYQVLRIGNIKQNDLRLSDNAIFIDELDSGLLNKSLLKEGDLVVTQTGTRHKRDYGFVAMIERNNLLLNQRNACIRFDNRLSAQFFLFYSYTELYKDSFFANEGGTVGQGNVGLSALKEMVYYAPPLSEQQAIVSRLDQLSEKVKRLQEIQEKTIKECDALKQAILREVFE